MWLTNSLLIKGFCNFAIVEQHAAAGSPEAVNIPCQYSFYCNNLQANRNLKFM